MGRIARAPAGSRADAEPPSDVPAGIHGAVARAELPVVVPLLSGLVPALFVPGRLADLS